MNQYRKNKHLESVEKAVLTTISAYNSCTLRYIKNMIYASYGIPGHDVEKAVKRLVKKNTIRCLNEIDNLNTYVLNESVDRDDLELPLMLTEGMRFHSNVDRFSI